MKSITKTLESLPLIYRSKSNAERLITVIGDYPFYQSSGYNSGQVGTFLPFGGLIYYPVGFFKKPKHEQDAHHYFPKLLLTFIKNNEMEINPKRFGNLETLLISMEMGGGYWLTPAGFKLKFFLCSHFANQIIQVKEKYKYCFDAHKKRHLNQITTYTEKHAKSAFQGINTINTILAKNSERIQLQRLGKKVQIIDLTDINYSDHLFSHDAVMNNLLPSPTENNNNPIERAKAYCRAYLIYSTTLKKLDAAAQQKRNVVFDMLTYLNDTTQPDIVTRLKNALNTFDNNKQLMYTHRSASFFTIIYDPQSKHLGDQVTALYEKLKHHKLMHKIALQ